MITSDSAERTYCHTAKALLLFQEGFPEIYRISAPLNYHRMAHKLRVVSPGLDFALCQRGRQIDDALVR